MLPTAQALEPEANATPSSLPWTPDTAGPTPGRAIAAAGNTPVSAAASSGVTATTTRSLRT